MQFTKNQMISSGNNPEVQVRRNWKQVVKAVFYSPKRQHSELQPRWPNVATLRKMAVLPRPPYSIVSTTAETI
jgi:hypothetical protein